MAGFFARCPPEERFVAGERLTGSVAVWDWDTRRVIKVESPLSVNPQNDPMIFAALTANLDSLPQDVLRVTLDNRGHVTGTGNDYRTDDQTTIPFYPLRKSFGANVSTLHRSALTEVQRMGQQVDRVTWTSSSGGGRNGEVVVHTSAFKYNFFKNNIAMIWHEMNCHMRIPKHPNIVPFEALVTEAVGGTEKVVGFTTPYIPGGTVWDHPERIFKLKHLRQLMAAVDFINLTLGIVHGDIKPFNLLLDETTDNIMLFDFNWGSQLGNTNGDLNHNREFWYDEDRNDVKFVAYTLWEILAHDQHFRAETPPRLYHISDILGPAFAPASSKGGKKMAKPGPTKPWTHHRNVKLDAPVDEYRTALEAWVRERMTKDKVVNHYKKASKPITWDSLPPFPPAMFCGSPQPMGYQFRVEMSMDNEPFIAWERPATSKLPLPKGKRLLATGQVVDSSSPSPSTSSGASNKRSSSHSPEGRTGGGAGVPSTVRRTSSSTAAATSSPTRPTRSTRQSASTNNTTPAVADPNKRYALRSVTDKKQQG